MATQFILPRQVKINVAGRPYAGAKAYFYQTDTETPQLVYQDSALTVPHVQPVVADDDGYFPVIWLNPDASFDYRVQILSATGSLLDDVPAVPARLISSAQIIEDVTHNLDSLKRTQAEIDARVTPVNSYMPGNVLRYGTNTTPGITDMTAAIQAAIDQHAAGGAPVYVPCGIYLTSILNLPNSAVATQQGFRLYGDGAYKTVFQAKNANEPIFRKALSSGSLEYAVFGDFSLKAHASGSTTGAFLCTGLRTCTFERIFGQSNGSSGFFTLFDLAAAPYLCYGNAFRDCGLAAQTGWSYVWNFNSGGSGLSANNANMTLIVNPWVYANTGLLQAIDALRSAKTSIISGLIEANTGATGIQSGTATIIQGVWFELNAADIAYATATDGASNGGIVMGCYFSTAHTINFTGVEDNVWLGNTEAGAQTWSGASTSNLRLKGAGATATAPTFARTAGDTGTLTFNSATLKNDPNLQNSLSYILIYTWTSTSAGTFTQFVVSPPSGWTITALAAGSTRSSSGQPRAVAVNGSATFSTDNVSNDAHTLAVYVTIQHTN